MDESTKKLALEIALAARNKKAEDIKLLDVHGVVDYADFLVICSGRSERQVGAIAEAIDEAASKQGIQPLGIEGKRSRRWVLIDCGEVVAHVFHDETRLLYDLDRLWFDAPRLELPAEEPPILAAAPAV
ncbi:MAG: ribosome silencing factor [Myxococcota bacterium]|jgi:ribosome-associated protein|nr:ribosome silencing factor [Myxococcota bacterium]